MKMKITQVTQEIVEKKVIIHNYNEMAAMGQNSIVNYFPMAFPKYNILAECEDGSKIACESLNPFLKGEVIEISERRLRDIFYSGSILTKSDDGKEYKVKRLGLESELGSPTPKTPLQAQPI